MVHSLIKFKLLKLTILIAVAGAVASVVAKEIFKKKTSQIIFLAIVF